MLDEDTVIEIEERYAAEITQLKADAAASAELVKQLREDLAALHEKHDKLDAECRAALPLLDAVADVLKTHGPRRRDEAVAPAIHRAGAHVVALEVLRTRAAEWSAAIVNSDAARGAKPPPVYPKEYAPLEGPITS